MAISKGFAGNKEFLKNLQEVTGQGASPSAPAATLSLSENFSGAVQTAATALPANEIHDAVQTAQDHAKTEEQLKQGQSLLNGNLTEQQVSTTLTGAFAAKAAQMHQQAEERRKRATNDALWLELLDQVRHDVHALESELETMFEDESWREMLANIILDEVPPRGDNETIEQYRDRLEKELVEEMLNDDGTIKDEYKNHADERIQKAAKWAEEEKRLQRLENDPEYARSEIEKITNIKNKTAIQSPVQEHTQAVETASNDDFFNDFNAV